MADAPGQNKDAGGGDTGDQNTDDSTDTGSKDDKSKDTGGEGDKGSDTAVDAKDYESTWDDPKFRNHPRSQQLLKDSKELKELREKTKEKEDKSLEEQKKFQELADKRGKELADAQEKNKNLQIDNALGAKLADAKAVSIPDALKLVDRSKLDIKDDGSVDGVDAVVESLKTEKPYLFNAGSGAKLGSATNPGNEGGQAGGQVKFKRSQLTQEFYKANKKEIDEAFAKGLVEDDGPPSA